MNALKAGGMDTQEMNKILIVIFANFSSSVISQSKDVTQLDASIGCCQIGQGGGLFNPTVAARFTFKVDNVCGNIYELVATKNDDLIWDLKVSS